MKYQMMKDLPFIKKDAIFGTGCWASGGFGIDLGETHYDGGGSSHNGTETFSTSNNLMLEEILDNKEWVNKVPESMADVLTLYNDKYITKTQALVCLDNLTKQEEVRW